MLRRRPERDQELRDIEELKGLLGTPIEASDLDMEQLSRQEVQEQPERRLGAMSPEDLSAVEVAPKPAGQVLRGRVGAGAPEPKPAFSAEATDLSNAKSATGKSAVLRQPVGGDPRRTARRLADLMQHPVSDDEIAQEDSTLAAQGLSPQEREKRATDEAREFAVMSYAKRQEEAKAKYQDAVNRARADEENQGWLEQTLRGIADIAAAYGGQGPNVYSSLDKKERKATREGVEKRAKEEMDTTLAEGNTADQARMLAQRLRSAGIAIPEGMETQNPEAFNAVYGKVAPEKPGEDLETFEKKEQIRAKYRPAPQPSTAMTPEEREAMRVRGVNDARETARINDERDQATRRADKSAELTRQVDTAASEVDADIDYLIDLVKKNGTQNLTGSFEGNVNDATRRIAVQLSKLADPGTAAMSGEVAREMAGMFQPGWFQQSDTVIERLNNLKASVAGRKQRAYEKIGTYQQTTPAGATAPAPEASVDDLLEKYK